MRMMVLQIRNKGKNYTMLVEHEGEFHVLHKTLQTTDTYHVGNSHEEALSKFEYVSQLLKIPRGR